MHSCIEALGRGMAFNLYLKVLKLMFCGKHIYLQMSLIKKGIMLYEMHKAYKYQFLHISYTTIFVLSVTLHFQCSWLWQMVTRAGSAPHV